MGGVQPDENLRFLYVCIKNSRGNEQVSPSSLVHINKTVKKDINANQ